jgi:hypothetical protein
MARQEPTISIPSTTGTSKMPTTVTTNDAEYSAAAWYLITG